MEFEWDSNKADLNWQKHQITFDEATEIFLYPIYEMLDSRLDYGEERFIAIGRNQRFIFLTVVYTVRGFSAVSSEKCIMVYIV
ncbi:MAG: BrnT family toxin [Snowella sp.]|nr:BrnT family toxin [Snowella sp.]